MTLRLIVMRHATAVPATWHDDDHARALTPVGMKEAASVAKQLKGLDWVPQYIVHSDALRTTQSAEALAKHLRPAPTLEASSEFYLASSHTLRGLLSAWTTLDSPRMVLAHNPGVSSFATSLCDCSLSMQPGAAALLEHAPVDDWALALTGNTAWRLVDFIRPMI